MAKGLAVMIGVGKPKLGAESSAPMDDNVDESAAPADDTGHDDILRNIDDTMAWVDRAKDQYGAEPGGDDIGALMNGTADSGKAELLNRISADLTKLRKLCRAQGGLAGASRGASADIGGAKGAGLY